MSLYPPHPNTKILLVEDDPDDALLLQEMMKEKTETSYPYEIDHVDCLAKALQKLQNNQYDIILLDLSLPDSQGLNAFLELYKFHDSAPIVALTSLNDQNAALEALGAGAQDYLVKGTFNSRALKRVIRYSIERNQLLAKIEQSSEERFRKLIENDSDGMLVIDKKGIVQFANPASFSILNLQEDEVIHKPFQYPFQANSFNEIEIMTPEGKSRIIDMHITELEWEKKPAYLAAIHDITETREIERLKAEVLERRKLDTVKDNFISAVSHEIRTPLTIIKASLSNMEAGINGELNPKQKEVLNNSLKNVDRLNRIIQNILDLSRLESGRASVNIRTNNLEDILGEMRDGFAQEAKQKGLELIFEIPPYLPSFESDPDMIIQVLNNLLSNALRFAENKIVVQAKEISNGTSSHIEVIVRDDGEGIPPEKFHLLFNKFEQINRPMGGAGYKGTGLGLVICKEIVELLQGKIWAECSRPHCTEFHFTIPLKQNSMPLK